MAILSSSTLHGDSVYNRQGEKLGSVEDFMIDTESGRVVYAVLSFGGFLGIGDKLFAIPVQMLEVDTDEERFLMDVDKQTLENAPGFDKNDWPSTADRGFVDRVYSHYGYGSYYKTA